MPLTILSTLIDEQYPTLANRSTGEIVAEVEWLCDQAAALIAATPHDEPSHVADALRARAIGVLWAAGIHPTHAEAWADVTIEAVLFDHTDLPAAVIYTTTTSNPNGEHASG
jgi:hypothetical protein